MSETNGTGLQLRLYIAGRTPNSVMALQTLETLLAGRQHTLEVVDVLQSPERALDDGIFVTPTVVRLTPAPQVSVIGALGPGHQILHLFGG